MYFTLTRKKRTSDLDSSGQNTYIPKKHPYFDIRIHKVTFYQYKIEILLKYINRLYALSIKMLKFHAAPRIKMYYYNT